MSDEGIRRCSLCRRAGVHGGLQSERRRHYHCGEIEAGRDLYAGLRVGAAITPETLLYAKAGYTNASFDVTAFNAAQETAVSNVDLDGWRVGAGVERAITDNAFLKAEYRYSNYQEGEFEAPSGLESDRFDVDLDRHTVMVGLGMRF